MFERGWRTGKSVPENIFQFRQNEKQIFPSLDMPYLRSNLSHSELNKAIRQREQPDGLALRGSVTVIASQLSSARPLIHQSSASIFIQG